MADAFDAFPDAPTQAAPAADPYASFPDVPRIDFGRPDAEVRAEIGRLTGPARKAALDMWADKFVARERGAGGVGMAVDNTVRTLTRGSFVGPFIDEANAATEKVLQTITGGAIGSDYDEALAYQRARDRAVDRDYPVSSTVGKLAGGVAGVVAALPIAGVSAATSAAPAAHTAVRAGQVAVGGPLAAVTPAATLPGRMAQGAGIGAGYGAAAGFGNAEGGDGSIVDQAAARATEAVPAAGVGAVVGAAAPPVIEGATALAGRVADAMSPQIARLSQQTRNILEEAGVIAPPRPPSSAGAMANPAPPAQSTGADAAADQIIANQLSRANVSAADLRQRMAQQREATRYGSDGVARDVTAPVDLDPSLQRLAGSVARKQPEAGNLARNFTAARQTGMTPAAELPPTAGLPTRAEFTQPGPMDPPMGQFERVRDAMRRAIGIGDGRRHGFAPTAYRTEQEIVETARREADQLYKAAYDAGDGVDLRPTVTPIMQRWVERAADEPREIRNAIRSALAEFRSAKGPVSTLQRFDKAKQALDDRIDKLFIGGDRYLGGVLAQFKNEMLEAVDTVATNRLGPLYSEARAAFGSRMEMRDALILGRAVFREDSEVVVDQFHALTPAQQNLFRLGLVAGFEQHMGRQPRQTDITRVFASPRVQEIIEAVIPRSREAGATFSNRPERFGRYLQGERQMVQTRAEVLGGAQTAERLADDAALNSMSNVIEQIRQTPTLTTAAIRLVERSLDRLFGFRADTAAAVARKLFTADPAERDQVLLQIAERLGPTRAAQMAEMMRQAQSRLVPAGARGVPTTEPGGDNGGGGSSPPAAPPPGMMRLGGPKLTDLASVGLAASQGQESTTGSGIEIEAPPVHHSARQPRSETGQFKRARPAEVRQGPKARFSNEVADYARAAGLTGLADRLNDRTSGAGMIANAVGDLVVEPVRAGAR